MEAEGKEKKMITCNSVKHTIKAISLPNPNLKLVPWEKTMIDESFHRNFRNSRNPKNKSKMFYWRNMVL